MTKPILRVFIELNESCRYMVPSGVVTFRSTDDWPKICHYLNPEDAKARWVMREDTGEVWIPNPYENRSNTVPGPRLSEEQMQEFLLIQLRATHV
jgi:hypothetical protein